MSLSPLAERMRAWMFGAALPLWAERGVDRRYGGFVEALTFDGADAALDYKRVRVACRQIYVFSHAKMLGWSDGEAIAADGAAYLVEKAWRKGQGGFGRRLTRAGELHDPTPDLYDNAFALFAFAWAHRATGDPAYRDLAARTFDWIDDTMRDPAGKGFLHQIPPAGWRTQNPHMHLLEACLAAFEATADPRYKKAAIEIVDLFETRFFDRHAGALGEFFTDDWSRAPGDAGWRIEPGHQFEWAWLLQTYQRRLGPEIDYSAEPYFSMLSDFAERYGINEYGAVMNTVSREGAPIDAGSRAWPNTERLKAAVARARLEGRNWSNEIENVAGLLLDRYLSSTQEISIPDGAWIDAFDAAGHPTAANVPASTFYHLFLAFAETLQLASSAAKGGGT